MKNFLCILLTATVLFLGTCIGGCNNAQTAQGELKKMNIEVNAESFKQYLEKGDLKVVQLFLQSGMSPQNGLTDDKSTPLHWATISGNKDLAALLIKKGADVKSKNMIGQSPLHWAANNGSKDITALLIDKGADVNEKDHNGMTPLLFAVEKSHVDVVKLLVDRGADVKIINNSKYTAMHLVSSKKIAEILLLKKADTSTVNLNGKTPLQEAKERGRKDIVDLLTKKGVKK